MMHTDRHRDATDLASRHDHVRSANRTARCSRRRAAALVMVVLFLPIIVGTVAFAVDFGMMVVLRSQIQNAVDAGALAASLKLSADPTAVEDAAAAAREYVRLNRVGSTVRIPEDAIDVETGTWDADTGTFTATTVDPTSVRVFARQDDQPFAFAGIFGQTSYGAPASAIATGSGAAFDIMMVLDLSGSMKDEGRIEALRNAAPIFVDTIADLGGSNQIGVMGLSANPSNFDPLDLVRSVIVYVSGLHHTPNHHVGILENVLTDDFSVLKSDALSPTNLVPAKYGTPGWTGTGAALGDAAHYLTYGAEARPDVSKAIVLMSDGRANRPSSNGSGYALVMAEYADSLGVKVYTISLGNGADLDLMQQIADITGGSHFDATGSGEAELTNKLEQAFEGAAGALKRNLLVK